jgi:hypothetical protein
MRATVFPSFQFGLVALIVPSSATVTARPSGVRVGTVCSDSSLATGTLICVYIMFVTASVRFIDVVVDLATPKMPPITGVSSGIFARYS